jgi:outer membrane protein assembly factor BamA
VFAVRGKTTFTRTASGQQVPFFMQPTLGGSEDLRGFREYRFRDGSAVILNAEYRWEAFSGLDLALFIDAGQVAPRLTDIDFADLQKSYGFGFRFNTSKSVFMRVDVGLSKEGRQVFLKFNRAF